VKLGLDADDGTSGNVDMVEDPLDKVSLTGRVLTGIGAATSGDATMTSQSIQAELAA
jgi:hypothetical protein